jgi:hypothetical protein
MWKEPSNLLVAGSIPAEGALIKNHSESLLADKVLL